VIELDSHPDGTDPWAHVLESMTVERCPLHQDAQVLRTALLHLVETVPAPRGDHATAWAFKQATRALAQTEGARDPVVANAYRLYAVALAVRDLQAHDCPQCRRGYHCEPRQRLVQRLRNTHQDVMAEIHRLEQDHAAE
jgi:hypothetical protein